MSTNGPFIGSAVSNPFLGEAEADPRIWDKAAFELASAKGLARHVDNLQSSC